MNRREFVAELGGAAAWPLAVPAQQPKVYKIGVLITNDPEYMPLFREELRKLGYVEGQNILIEYRSADGKLNLLTGLAADLVRLKVDIILASQTPAVEAAKQATREIPIVMASTGDPVATGLVASLARPGGNVTGLSSLGSDMGGKCLELIREVVPSARRVAVLANAPDPFAKPFLEQIRLAAETAGIEIQPIMVHAGESLEAAFSTTITERVDALIVQPSLPTKDAVDLALRRRLPAIGLGRVFPGAGGLMGYGSVADRGREAAVYIDKILKGSRPADLPIQQPTKFELVVNLRTAKAIGITISESFLLRADELID